MISIGVLKACLVSFLYVFAYVFVNAAPTNQSMHETTSLQARDDQVPYVGVSTKRIGTCSSECDSGNSEWFFRSQAADAYLGCFPEA